jgi:cytochrome oxidase Cu insertion factor (SCO1/SenC/PrrC family)
MFYALFISVVLLALLGVVNLALVLRLSKVYREHVDLEPAGPPATDFPVGADLPGFAVTTTAGDALTDADLTSGRVLVAFLSTTCVPCHDSLPELRETASELAVIHSGRTLAIVSSPPHVDHARMVAGLPAQAEVVTYADYQTPVHEAFHITAYPTYLLFSDGVAVSVSTSVGAVRTPVPA